MIAIQMDDDCKNNSRTDAAAPALRENLRHKGFDICVPFRPEWYNTMLNDEGLDLIRLPTENVSSACLIGNTSALWPVFVQWCRVNYSNGDLPLHPLDEYCRECIEAAVGTRNCKIFWAAEFCREGLVSMQRVAVASGFAYHDRNTQLTIHPTYGTWKAYRAVVVFFGEGRSEGSLAPPPRVPKLLNAQEEAKAAAAMERALDLSDTFNLCQQLHKSVTFVWDKAAMAWIAVRDAVELGKAKYRYGESQLMYHYTKDKKFIKIAMAEGENADF